MNKINRNLLRNIKSKKDDIVGQQVKEMIFQNQRQKIKEQESNEQMTKKGGHDHGDCNHQMIPIQKMEENVVSSEIQHELNSANFNKLSRYFKQGEMSLTNDELLKRQRKHAMDRQFFNNLCQMCTKIKELRYAFLEIEKL